jgi:hypothetical protein
MKNSMFPGNCKSFVYGLIVIATLVLLVAGTASAQQSSSPQGGTAIYNGMAPCVGSSFTGATSGPNTGPLPPPCTDGTNNGLPSLSRRP